MLRAAAVDSHRVPFQRRLAPERRAAKTAFEVPRDGGAARQRVPGQVRLVLERPGTALADVPRVHAAFVPHVPHEVVPLRVAAAAPVRTEVPRAGPRDV